MHTLAERLKQTPCPHCRVVGTLIRHGCLYGLDDSSPRRTVRARRVFCSIRTLRHKEIDFPLKQWVTNFESCRFLRCRD